MAQQTGEVVQQETTVRLAMLEKQMAAMIDRYNRIANDYARLRLQVLRLLDKDYLDPRLDYLGRI